MSTNHKRKLIGALAVFIAIAGSLYPADIKWDNTTLRLIQPGAAYGRMIRLPSGDILCAYERHGRSWTRKSTDNGSSWQQEQFVAEYAHGPAANPEVLLLDNGTILFFYNERPHNDEHAFAIIMLSSSDSGETWSEPHRLYETKGGCWEPVARQLPDGEVQMFFANEGPFPDTYEQEITMMRSHDNGASWSPPERIAYRTDTRDGMPVPVVLKDNKGIAVAIEDDGLNGKFKPVIIHTTLEDNWHQPYADGDSPRRWRALAEPLPADVYAAAPYIVQMPDGTTVLSVQSTEGNRDRHMAVYLGDSDAKNFGQKTVPFIISDNTAGQWNALFVKDEQTVTALSGTVINGTYGLWSIDGKIVP